MLLAATVTVATVARDGGSGNGQRRNGGSGEKGLAKHGKRPLQIPK